MTVGPDHAIWFTSYSLIGRITTTGQVSWFNPNPHKNPDTLIDIAGITTGPDGNLWFATANQAVGRLTPSGTFTFYRLPSNYDFDAGSSSLTMNQFKDIATASDGTLWLTDGDQLGHFS
jgi:virginiamycin B lyase